jgi:hypothetical protein
VSAKHTRFLRFLNSLTHTHLSCFVVATISMHPKLILALLLAAAVSTSTIVAAAPRHIPTVCLGSVVLHDNAPLSPTAPLQSTQVQIRVEPVSGTKTAECRDAYPGLPLHLLEQAEFESLSVDGDVLVYHGPTVRWIQTVKLESRPTWLFGLLAASWRVPAFQVREQFQTLLDTRARGTIAWNAPEKGAWTHMERFCQWRSQLEEELRSRRLLSANAADATAGKSGKRRSSSSTTPRTAPSFSTQLPFGLARLIPCPACPGQNRAFERWVESNHLSMQARRDKIDAQVRAFDQRIADLKRQCQKAKTAASFAASAVLHANASFATWMAAQALVDVAADTLLTSRSSERKELEWQREQLVAKAKRVETRKWPRYIGAMMDHLDRSAAALDWRHSWQQVCAPFPLHGLLTRALPASHLV